MPTPFEAGKTAEELGIDTSRTFVVVNDRSFFKEGEQVRLDKDYLTPCPRFKSTKTGEKHYCFWSELAYAEELEPYEPRVGDRVSLEGEVVEVSGNMLSVKFSRDKEGDLFVGFQDASQLKLLSRKTRKLTKEEAERLLSEKLNEQITIE